MADRDKLIEAMRDAMLDTGRHDATALATAAFAVLEREHVVVPVDLVRKFLEHSSSDYVPNGLFCQLRDVLAASQEPSYGR